MMQPMSGSDFDAEKPNALGRLDTFVTNFAISVIAVFPTFLTCVFKPWRLRDLLDRDEPEGRIGVLLAPGAFLILSLLVSFIIAAMLSTPETVNYNGSYIGPRLAVAVQSAASDGDIWKLAGMIMPIYGLTVFLGVIGQILRPWAGKDWSLRVSLRAAFYLIGCLVSWLMLTTAIIDLVRLRSGSNDIASSMYAMLIIPTVVTILWIYYNFFRNGDAVPKPKSAVLSVSMVGLIIASMVGVDVLVRL